MRDIIDATGLYEADEHAWRDQQITALREGRLGDIDRPNLVDYLQEMARRDRDRMRSAFIVLLQHLLKARVQAEKASRSWALTIVEQQDRVTTLLRDMPSLNSYKDGLYAEAFAPAVRRAEAETGLSLSIFPTTNPWSLDEALTFKLIL